MTERDIIRQARAAGVWTTEIPAAAQPEGHAIGPPREKLSLPQAKPGQPASQRPGKSK